MTWKPADQSPDSDRDVVGAVTIAGVEEHDMCIAFYAANEWHTEYNIPLTLTHWRDINPLP